MKTLYTFITVLLYTTTNAQYFAKQGIYVLQQGQYAHGMDYKGEIAFPDNYNTENLDSILSKLAPDIYKLNGNAIAIIQRMSERIEFNKRYTRIKKRETKEYNRAEVFYANNVENLRPISDTVYMDSLLNELIDTAKEALIVIYPSLRLQKVKDFPVNSFGISDKERCTLERYTVCSHIATEEFKIYFNAGYPGVFSVDIKIGHVYFFEYEPSPFGILHPADFLISYRICSNLQKINRDIKQLKGK